MRKTREEDNQKMSDGAIPIDFQRIDKSIEKFLANVPQDLLEYLKANFDRHIPIFLGSSFRLELKLVIDSSSVISNLISFARKGKSILHKLVKEPFLQLLAPSKIRAEVEKSINRICKEMKLDKKILLETWHKEILPRITLLGITDLRALSKGFEVVGRRDVTDVPFVALHLQMGTHGVVTRDKDIIELPVVRTWQVRGVSSLITVFKKGAFSFYVFSELLPNIFRIILGIGVAILRMVLEILNRIIQFFVNLSKTGIEALSRLPDLGKALLAMLAALAIVILIVKEEARDKLMRVLERVGEAVHNFASEVFDGIRTLLENLAPLVEVTLAALVYLFDSYSKTLDQLRTLDKGRWFL